ncbi:DUF559 domain-containing protein [bacterium]|nr:MAG: DUF559 domain-containing protein [bacterium]
MNVIDSGKKTIFVAMSGGVDSSVVAALLKSNGDNVVGVYMKNWSGEDFGIQTDCPWEKDVEDVKLVCDKLGIEMKIYNFEKEYREQVVNYFFDEYRAGRTPNPDILCNSKIKFGTFLNRALEEDADMIATGHYARVKSSTDNITPNLVASLSREVDSEAGRWVNYNTNLTKLNRHHKRATRSENHLWYDFLSKLENYKFTRQKPIGNFIVDFYCSKYNLAIELDGAEHFTTEGLEYDKVRTNYLNSLGINVLRFESNDVEYNFEIVCTKIKNYLTSQISQSEIYPPYQEGPTVEFANVNNQSKSVEYFLLKGLDQNKDQSYFLSDLNQFQLSKTLFPIGHLQKSEVRKLAEEFELPIATKKDSQGICFIGDIDVAQFLRNNIAYKPGIIVDEDSGLKVGEHDGIAFYTIGQREGLNKIKVISPHQKPYFVSSKNLEKNILYVVQGTDNPKLYKNSCQLENLHFINSKLFSSIGGVSEGRGGLVDLEVEVRYRAKPVRATLNLENNELNFAEPVRGISSGQSAVFYNGEVCFGRGIIQ